MNVRLVAWGGSLLLHGLLLGGLALLTTGRQAPVAVELYTFELLPFALTAEQKAAASAPAAPRADPPKREPQPQPEPIAARKSSPSAAPATEPEPAATPPESMDESFTHEQLDASTTMTDRAAPNPGFSEGPDSQAVLSQRYLAAQFHYIRDKIFSRLHYPAIARQMGWVGRVKLCFTILESGDIDGLKIVESSGHKLLDQQALKAVEKAAPFPPPPCAAEITLPVTFNLE